MIIFIALIAHWYLSLFFQTVFLHRYASHSQFTMSKGMEKAFHIGSFIALGSSYISAYAYGIMHRMHHAHTDTELDPHSPKNSPNALTMMLETRNNYFNIFIGKTEVEEKYKRNLPRWKAFDKIAHNYITRTLWGIGYLAFYLVFATEWWMFLFIPVHLAMGALHGVAVNWWAHKFGYVNFKQDNTSKNILPVDLFFVGEGYHNNHHKNPGRSNNAVRWFEIDFGYQCMWIMDKLNMIQLRPNNQAEKSF